MCAVRVPTDLHDCGKYLEINFSRDEQAERSAVTRPRGGKVEDLSAPTSSGLKNKLEKFECKVEQLLEERGYKIMWTPPTAQNYNRSRFSGRTEKIMLLNSSPMIQRYGTSSAASTSRMAGAAMRTISRRAMRSLHAA